MQFCRMGTGKLEVVTLVIHSLKSGLADSSSKASQADSSLGSQAGRRWQFWRITQVPAWGWLVGGGWG